MTRIVLTDGTGRWFDKDSAEGFQEEKYWDGNNNISYATGSQWEHEKLFRTAGGLFILWHWSDYQGSTDTIEEITAEDAAVWLSRNKYDPENLPKAVHEQFMALEMK